MRPRQTETCPICETEFRAGRLACPGCGADAQTGWKSQEELDYLSVELPEEDLRGEFDPATGTYRERGSRWFLVAAVLALIAMAVVAFLW